MLGPADPPWYSSHCSCESAPVPQQGSRTPTPSYPSVAPRIGRIRMKVGCNLATAVLVQHNKHKQLTLSPSCCLHRWRQEPCKRAVLRCMWDRRCMCVMLPTHMIATCYGHVRAQVWNQSFVFPRVRSDFQLRVEVCGCFIDAWPRGPRPETLRHAQSCCKLHALYMRRHVPCMLAAA